MSNAVPILIAVSLVMPFRVFEPGSASGMVQVSASSSFVCLADSVSSCESEVEDSELYFDNRIESEPPAHFHGCVAVLRCMFVAAADIDPLTCLPPPIEWQALRL